MLWFTLTLSKKQVCLTLTEMHLRNDCLADYGSTKEEILFHVYVDAVDWFPFYGVNDPHWFISVKLLMSNVTDNVCNHGLWPFFGQC